LVRLVFEVSNDAPTDALRSALSDVLRSGAHPVTEALDAPWEARVRFESTLTEAVEGLKVASGSASVQLVQVQSGKVAAEASVDSLVARGYSVPDLILKLGRQAAEQLSGALSDKLNSF